MIIYHYQVQDKNLQNLIALGSLYRICSSPQFKKINISAYNLELFKKFQKLLKTPSKIILTKLNSDLITISPSSKYLIKISVQKDGDKADLISKISQTSNFPQSQIISITGDGKGKTTLGLGFLLQNILNNKISQSFHFFKNPDFGQGVSEFKFPNIIKTPKLITMQASASGFLFPDSDKSIFTKHKALAQKLFSQIKTSLEKTNSSLILLDEIFDALNSNILDKNQLIQLIEIARTKNITLIFTGRKPKFLNLDFFDQNITITKIKHPFDQGKKAIPGLDY